MEGLLSCFKSISRRSKTFDDGDKMSKISCRCDISIVCGSELPKSQIRVALLEEQQRRQRQESKIAPSFDNPMSRRVECQEVDKCERRMELATKSF